MGRQGRSVKYHGSAQEPADLRRSRHGEQGKRDLAVRQDSKTAFSIRMGGHQIQMKPRDFPEKPRPNQIAPRPTNNDEPKNRTTNKAKPGSRGSNALRGDVRLPMGDPRAENGVDVETEPNRQNHRRENKDLREDAVRQPVPPLDRLFKKSVFLLPKNSTGFEIGNNGANFAVDPAFRENQQRQRKQEAR